MKQIFVLLICSCISLIAFADYFPSKDDPGLKWHKGPPVETQGGSTETNAECDACKAFTDNLETPLDSHKPSDQPGSGTPASGTKDSGTH